MCNVILGIQVKNYHQKKAYNLGRAINGYYRIILSKDGGKLWEIKHVRASGGFTSKLEQATFDFPKVNEETGFIRSNWHFWHFSSLIEISIR